MNAEKGRNVFIPFRQKGHLFQSAGEVPQMNRGAVPEAAVEEWVWASGRFIVA